MAAANTDKSDASRKRITRLFCGARTSGSWGRKVRKFSIAQPKTTRLISFIAEKPPLVLNSSSGKIKITSIKPSSGLARNKSKAGMAKILAIAMTGETLTNKYELAIARTSELIRMPESIKREYRSSKLFQ